MPVVDAVGDASLDGTFEARAAWSFPVIGHDVGMLWCGLDGCGLDLYA